MEQQLVAGLTLAQIEALKTFYEQTTGRSATEIEATADTGRTKEKQLRYILGIMRNRFFKASVETQGLTLLVDATNAGVSIENLKLYATSCSSWTQFREKVLELMESRRTKQ